MKKLLFVFLTIIGLQGFVIAQQRYAVIDTKYILDKIPEYKDAAVTQAKRGSMIKIGEALNSGKLS